jgi:alpha-beta hydrolase superfamily lysophospholipase
VIATLLSRRYRTSVPFSVTTEDGVRLVGSRVGRHGPALVFCHGFLGWHRKERIVRFVERLAARFQVYAFDLRGHGRSAGVSTFGDREYLDVDAVVALARRETGGPLASMGGSMGGIAVLRQAAFRDGVDAVVTVSTPARWDGHRSDAVRQIWWLTSTPAGRRLARVMGVRLTDAWDGTEDPEAVVERVAPVPLIIVHGRDDHFFDVEEAWRLYRRAGEPKRLLLASPFGHAEDGFTPSFADLVADRLGRVLAG